MTNAKNWAIVGAVVVGWVGVVQAQLPVTPPGTGTSADPYLISELGHLVWMGDNAGSSSGKYYTMTANIDASATATWNDAGTDTTILEGFKPIGTYSNPDTTSFRGIFDGNGHAITGLTISRPDTDFLGLLGCVGSGGQVKNLGLLSGAITGYGYVGSLVGYNYVGTISNCSATSAVMGTSGVGGLVGFNWNTVTNCYATGVVTGKGCVGGLVGGNFGGTVTNGYATGAVMGNDLVGGLVGQHSYGIVSNSYATGAVTATGTGTYTSVGGLIGRNISTVLNCYATGAVTGYRYVGGLIGISDSNTVWNCYWDTQTSGQSSSSGGADTTTAQMKQQATFAGWDFSSLWGIVEGTSYPYLRFAPPPFRLAVHFSGPGNVTVDPPSSNGTYAPGTVVTLTATPCATDDRIARWLGASPSGPFTATVVMDSHRSVTAEFHHQLKIASLTDLAKIGQDPAYPLSRVEYTLTVNIDASETATWNDAGTDTTILEGFKPIGTYSDPDTTSFRGIFDGNGHTITGLTINRSSTDGVGLFGCVGMGGQVKNLGLLSGAITGNQYVGSLVGYNCYGMVTKGYTTGAVAGGSGVGGLIGWNYFGVVTICYATGAVTGQGLVGGLLGCNFGGMVTICYATGAVTGGSTVGGLAGANSSGGKMSNGYATGAVTGDSTVGGLVGWNFESTIINCYATGAVRGNHYAGALIGNGAGSSEISLYWDIQTSGLSVSPGSRSKGKTTAEMQQQATFVGWDFMDIWGICEDKTYPFLRSLSLDTDGDDLFDVCDACPKDAANDADGDGVCGDVDACADSNLSATIVINGVNSGVKNQVLATGCSMSDEITKAAASARPRGAFVQLVAQLTHDWMKAGLITGEEKGRIQSAAARARFMVSVPVGAGVSKLPARPVSPKDAQGSRGE